MTGESWAFSDLEAEANDIKIRMSVIQQRICGMNLTKAHFADAMTNILSHILDGEDGAREQDEFIEIDERELLQIDQTEGLDVEDSALAKLAQELITLSKCVVVLGGADNGHPGDDFALLILGLHPCAHATVNMMR